MAWSSFVACGWLAGAIGSTTDYATTDTCYIALYNQSNAPTAQLSITNQEYANATYWPSSSNGSDECWSSTGSWAQGGVSVGTLTITNQNYAGGDISFAASGGNVSQATTTITNAFYGALVYDHTIAAKYGICAIYFGGSYTVGGGTLAINWGNDASGAACIFYITG
jgi:hypothetical protein